MPYASIDAEAGVTPFRKKIDVAVRRYRKSCIAWMTGIERKDVATFSYKVSYFFL
jgi:hypothetical protein